MSSGVSLRPTRDRRVLTANADEVVGWLSMLAHAHGLEMDGGGDQWLLAGEDLSLEVVLDTRRRGVREVDVAAHLFFADGGKERSVKTVWREILGELVAYAGRVGAVLHTDDGGASLDTADDLDAEAGLDRVDHRPEPESLADAQWAWSPIVGHPTAPDPMLAALVPVDPERGLTCDDATVRAWLAEREERYHDRVLDLASGWRVSSSTLLEVDLLPARDADLLVRLDLVATPSYNSVDEELGARRLLRFFLDDLDAFGRGVGGAVVVGDPPQMPDDEGLYEFVGMTRMARRRFLMPDGVRARGLCGPDPCPSTGADGPVACRAARETGMACRAVCRRGDSGPVPGQPLLFVAMGAA